MLILPLVHDLSQLTSQKRLDVGRLSRAVGGKVNMNININRSGTGLSLSAEEKVEVEVAFALSIWCIRRLRELGKAGRGATV